MKSGKIALSVVVPVYRNSQSLPEVVERIEGLQRSLQCRVEAVFVVDGSPDDSAAVLRRILPGSSIESQLLLHSRNFGAFSAVRTGFTAARGNIVSGMAADLQEPIELIEQFYERLATGNWDVAVGTRAKRDDPAGSRGASRLYWAFYRRVVQREMPPGGVDIFACTSGVAKQLASLNEANSSLIGLLFWLGYRRTDVPYSRSERRHGKSAWSLSKKFRYMLDSIFSFTSLPITLILMLGIFGTIVSFLTALSVFTAWLFGAIEVPGYTAQMLVLLLATGSLLFALGIVGTYVWRTFENTKSRPNSVVMMKESFGND
jgi:glycosyltransferase involved in cell wall biosynthesis